MIIINKKQKTLFSSFIIVTKSHFKSLVTATKPKPNLYQSVLNQMFSSSDSNRISSIVHLLVVADLGYIKNLFRSRMKNGEVHEYTCNKLLCQMYFLFIIFRKRNDQKYAAGVIFEYFIIVVFYFNIRNFEK